MSIFAKVISKGVHNKVMPDTWMAWNSPELSRIIHMTLIRVVPLPMWTCDVHAKYGNHTYCNLQ